MDLEAVAPVIEDIIRQSLYQKVYKFGFANNQGTSNKVASGTLARSVEVQIKPQKDYISLQILMEEYWQWVQSGRLKGKGYVPVGSLLKWIKQRGLKGRDKVTGRYIKDESFAYAIQKNINKFGIRPSNFLDVAMEKIMSDPRIEELIADSSYEELLNLIEGI